MNVNRDFPAGSWVCVQGWKMVNGRWVSTGLPAKDPPVGALWDTISLVLRISSTCEDVGPQAAAATGVRGGWSRSHADGAPGGGRSGRG